MGSIRTITVTISVTRIRNSLLRLAWAFAKAPAHKTAPKGKGEEPGSLREEPALCVRSLMFW